MDRLFAITYAPGAQWNASAPLEGQAEWLAHAAFMDALHAAGIVPLAGPLEGTQNVLMIMRARDAEEIHARLADDPWIRNEVRRIAAAVPWTLRLGSLS